MEFPPAKIYLPAWKYVFEYTTILRGLNCYINLMPSGIAGDRYKGYQGQEKAWEGYKFNKILLSQDSIVAYHEPEIIELFDSFLSYCKNNDIQVILVFTPQYIKATEFTKSWDEEMQVYHYFSEKYNIPFLDYSHDPLCYDTNYLRNAGHLNKKGAELFTLKLANDIKAQNLYKSGDCESSPQ